MTRTTPKLMPTRTLYHRTPPTVAIEPPDRFVTGEDGNGGVFPRLNSTSAFLLLVFGFVITVMEELLVQRGLVRGKFPESCPLLLLIDGGGGFLSQAVDADPFIDISDSAFFRD